MSKYTKKIWIIKTCLFYNRPIYFKLKPVKYDLNTVYPRKNVNSRQNLIIDINRSMYEKEDFGIFFTKWLKNNDKFVYLVLGCNIMRNLWIFAPPWKRGNKCLHFQDEFGV